MLMKRVFIELNVKESCYKISFQNEFSNEWSKLKKFCLRQTYFSDRRSSFLFMCTLTLSHDTKIVIYYMIVKSPGPDIVYSVVLAVTKLQ